MVFDHLTYGTAFLSDELGLGKRMKLGSVTNKIVPQGIYIRKKLGRKLARTSYK